MSVGGTTPSAELFESVRRRVRIPIAAMVRPRGGSFVYSHDELEQLWRDLDLMKSLGADVLVSGILNADGSVDRDRMRELVGRAGSDACDDASRIRCRAGSLSRRSIFSWRPASPGC